MTVVRRLFPAALLLVVFGADALVAQAGRVRNAWTSPCTLSVVLVTFKDTTGQASGDTYDYGARDLPHGYSVNSTTGALEPGTSATRWTISSECSAAGIATPSMGSRTL